MNRELTLFLIVVFACLTSNRSVIGCEICVDLYTQYLLPWGGQGLNMVSDAFPPEGVVELRMNVTFHGDGVPGKLVSFMIKAPNGETYSAAAFTQADGIAIFEYSLPSSEDYFGQWTVKASVDIGGTMVSDTLYFLMGWLVEVVKIDAPAIAYKGETMGVTVVVTRICMQDPRDIMNMLLKYPSGCPDNYLLLYITVTDELNQPVATSKLNMTMITELGVYDLDDFVKTMGEQWMDHVDIILTQYSELARTVMTGIPISLWSFSGNAKIRANLITNCPGISYCPEGSKYAYLRSSISNMVNVTYRTDLNKDGTVNIEDLSTVAKAYGSHGPDVPDPGDRPSESWNPIADVNKDNWVNIWDLCEIAKDCRKTA